jgi:hypothetical protein
MLLWAVLQVWCEFGIAKEGLHAFEDITVIYFEDFSSQCEGIAFECWAM